MMASYSKKHGGRLCGPWFGCFVAFCCVYAGSAAAWAEKRVALIVGNSAYAHIAGLPNVPSDAKAMGALFKAASFDAIDVLINLDVGQLRRALKMFAGKAADADVAVLYYAGHGIEVGQTNYLIPVDARLATDFDVEDETVPLIPSVIRSAGAKRNSRRVRWVALTGLCQLARSLPTSSGLYDMHGNVGEWVQDCAIATAMGCEMRVQRGGSWYATSQYLRSASRSRMFPGHRSTTDGFRVARTLNP